MREFNSMNENQLKKYIKTIIESDEAIIKEQHAGPSPDQLFNGIIKPWLNVLKVVKLESQKLLNTVLLFLRTALTFNATKLQNLRKNYQDRMEKLDREIGPLISQGGLEADFIAFALSPAAYIASQASKSEYRVGIVDYFRGAGFGDLLPSEMDSPNTNREKLDRARDEQGIVAKTLRALNDLFLAGYAAPGEIIFEQIEGEEEEEDQEFDLVTPESVDLSEDSFSEFLKASGVLEDVEEEKQNLQKDADEFLAATDSALKFAEVLSEVGNVANIEDYISLLQKLNSVSEDVKVTSKSEIQSSIEEDVKKLLSNPEAVKEAARIYLKNNGVSDPSQEELSKVSPENIENEIREIAFSNILGRLFGESADTIGAIHKSHLSTYEDLSGSMDKASPEIKKIILDSDYGKALAKSKFNLDQIKIIQNRLIP